MSKKIPIESRSEFEKIAKPEFDLSDDFGEGYDRYLHYKEYLESQGRTFDGFCLFLNSDQTKELCYLLDKRDTWYEVRKLINRKPEYREKIIENFFNKFDEFYEKDINYDMGFYTL